MERDAVVVRDKEHRLRPVHAVPVLVAPLRERAGPCVPEAGVRELLSSDVEPLAQAPTPEDDVARRAEPLKSLPLVVQPRGPARLRGARLRRAREHVASALSA